MIREDEEERKREEGNQREKKKRQKLGPHGRTTMTTALVRNYGGWALTYHGHPRALRSTLREMEN